MVQKKILIAALPHSGTMYMSKVLQAVGMKIGHEVVMENGTVSFLHIGSGYYGHWGRLVESWDFYKIIHMVRHPLKVISSMLLMGDSTIEYILRHVGRPPSNTKLHRCMFCWYHWNKYIEGHAVYRFRIEDIDNAFSSLSHHLGFNFDEIPDIPRDTNTHKPNPRYQAITWAMMNSTDAMLTRDIKSLATEYGYEL